jgi:chromosome segregation ATPase
MVGRSQHSMISSLARPLARPVAVLSCAAALVLLAGCDKPSAQNPLHDAEQQFAVLTARGTNVALIEADRKAKLTKLAADLAPLTREGDVQGPAAVLASKAKSALATIAAQRVGENAQLMQIGLTELRAELSGFVLHSSQAESASKFNIETEGKALRERLAAATSELGEATQQLVVAQTTVADLDRRLESLRASATAARDNAASLRAQISSVNAQQGFSLAQQAQQASLAADKIDTELTLLSNDRTLAGYQLQQADARKNAIEAQVSRVQADLAAMTSRATQMQAMAATSRQTATAAASTISQKFAAVKQLRAEKVMAPLAEARKLADEAVSMAQIAVNKAQGGTAQGKAEATTAAKLGLISAQQMQADLLNEQARLDESFAGTVGLLATSQPALPEASTFAAAADEARKSYEESIKQARELYTKLVESLQGVGGEKLKDRRA